MKKLLWAVITICLCWVLGVALGAGQGSLAQASQRFRPLLQACNQYQVAANGDWNSQDVGITDANGYTFRGISGNFADAEVFRSDLDFLFSLSSSAQLFDASGYAVIYGAASGTVTFEVCAPSPTATPTTAATDTPTPSNTPTATTVPTVTPTPTVSPYNCYVAIVLANDEWIAADNGVSDTTGYIFYTTVDTTLLTLWDGVATLGYIGLAPFSVNVSGASVQNSGESDAPFTYCSPAPLTVEQLTFFTLTWQVFIGLLLSVMVALIYAKVGRNG